MSCQFFRQQIELELDGELSAQEGVLLDSHLQQCPPCRQYRADALILWNKLADLDLELPGNIAGPVLTKLARRRAWKQLGIAAIILLAVISLFPFLIQGVFLTRAAFLRLEWHWFPVLLRTIWQAAKVMFKGWTLLTGLLPQEYWLGFAGLAIIDMVMLIKIFSINPAKGAR